jgi:HK97 family phage major capsid protein
MNIFFKLKSGYADRATWIVHRDLLKTLRKLKDSDGNYIWQPFDFPGKQLTGTNPGLIMGRPYETSEYAPKQTNNAWVDAQYLLAFGDFSHYWTLTAMQMEMQVLTELYAEENYIAYIGRMWVDGAPVLEEAFARLVYQS